MLEHQKEAHFILETIKEYDTIIIHRHQSPDPDALGSQAGLATILKASFPNKTILLAGGPVNDLDYLAEMDEIEPEQYEQALVIVTDTANTPRISGEQYHLGQKLIKIDHHPNDDAYGDFIWVNTKASSTSEMIYDFYALNQDELTMTSEAARVLYAGIIGDTGRFLYPSTTSHTLHVASQLRKYPFDSALLGRQMEEVDTKIARLTGYIYENLKVDSKGAGLIVLTQTVLKSFDVQDFETHAVVSLPGKIKEVVSWIVAVEQPEGHYRLRIRSKGPIINEIAKEHHGGGHPLASGANARDLDEVQVVYGKIKHVIARQEQR